MDCLDWFVILSARVFANMLSRRSPYQSIACGFAVVLAVAGPVFSAESPTQTIPPRWVFSGEGHSDSSPAIGPDGTIYLGTFKGNLVAVNERGYKKWAYSTGHEIRSSPSVGSDGAVYFGGRDRKVYALTPGGRNRWEFKTGGWVDASPAIATSGAILFGSWDGLFYSVSPQGGLNWSFQTGGPVVSSAAIFTNGNVCFGSHDGWFYTLDSQGQEAWRFKTEGAILSSPALDWAGNAYVTSMDGNLYALSPAGKLLWKVHTGSIKQGSPVLGTNGLVFLGTEGALWAVQPSGQFKRVPFEGETVDTAAVVTAAGEVIFIYRNGQACAYTPELDYRWRSVVYSAGTGSPSMSESGQLYVPGLANTLTAVPCASGLAATPWPKFRGNVRNTGNLTDALPR
jgi:outer membrane protein assembly factor BamB